MYYEVNLFLQLLDRFINQNTDDAKGFGTQHIWGNLFHVTLIGFAPMNDDELKSLQSVLKNMESNKGQSNISENVSLKWRVSHDKGEPLHDFRFIFQNEAFCSMIKDISNQVPFYHQEQTKRKLRLKNDYHASLLSDVALDKKEEIVKFLADYKQLIPHLYTCLVEDSDKETQSKISDMFKQLRWSIKIVSYEDVKNPLVLWKEHDTFII